MTPPLPPPQFSASRHQEQTQVALNGKQIEETKATRLLLDLPAELHHWILRDLPFSSRILYQTQVCSTLRRLFSGHGLLTKSHRFDLVEWAQGRCEVKELLSRQVEEEEEEEQQQQQQQQQVTRVQKWKMEVRPNELDDDDTKKRKGNRKSIWDVSPSTTPRPAPSKSSRSGTTTFNVNQQLSSLLYNAEDRDSSGAAATRGEKDTSPWSLERPLEKLIYGDHPEVAFFVRCLRLMEMQQRRQSQYNSTLLSQSRRSSNPLTVLSLLSRTGMKVASLIQLLETDKSLYNVETILMTSASFIDAVLWTVFTPPRVKASRGGGRLDTRQSTHFDLQFSHSTCIDTQAIVIPGPLSTKGQGLRSGFKCLCFSNYHHHHLHRRQEEAAADGGDLDLDALSFHVIFHDWYNEEEAISTQDMLEHSEISCNTCKRTIVF